MTELNLNLSPSVGLDLKLAPKLTAQLRQSIALLQLSHHDLQNIIHEHLNQNPVLKLAGTETTNASSDEPLKNQAPANFFEQDLKMTHAQSHDISKNFTLDSHQNSATQLSSEQPFAQFSDVSNLESGLMHQTAAPLIDYQIKKNQITTSATNANADNQQKTDAHYEKLSNTPQTLDFREDLLSQLSILRLSQLELALTSYLIQNLDDRGFLLEDLSDILNDLKKISEEIQMQDLQKAYKILTSLSPAGVGAPHVLACLRLNLEDILKGLGIGMSQREKRWLNQLALQLIDYLIDQQNQQKEKYKQNKSWAPKALNLSFSIQMQKKIAKALGISPHKIEDIIQLIRKLPQQPIQSNDKVFTQSEYIIADIIVVEKKQHQKRIFQAFLNDALIPKLSINLDCASSLTDDQTEYLKKKTQEAHWLINSIEKRFDTLKKLATLIVSEQQKFFEHGESAMQPMTMQEAANQLGIHVSTVSRIICHKYLQCKRGIYPIRYFFSKEIVTANGRVSSVAIKECIKNLINKDIEEEQSSSDLLLTQKLLAMGLNISRRTVAKYRKELGIQASHQRNAKQNKTQK